MGWMDGVEESEQKKKLLPFGLNPAARLPRLTHLTLPALAKLRRAAGHGLYLFSGTWDGVCLRGVDSW